MKMIPAFHELCASDDLRPVLSYVKLTKEKIAATNAMCMGWCDTLDVFDRDFIEHIKEGSIIHSDDWKKLFRGVNVQWKKEGEVIKIIHKNKRDELIEVDFENNVGRYVNWEAVIPDGEASLNHIGVNPNILMQVQKFFNPVNKNGCKLSFTGQTRGIMIEPHWGTEERTSIKAFIMPIIL